MVKFLHTSDWHLGITRHFLNEEAEPRYRQDRLDAVRRMGELAREEGCQFILAAGDLLDSNHVDPRTLARLAEVLRSVPVPVYLLPGNHDPADAACALRGGAISELAHVHVLHEGNVVEVVPGVELVPAPWRTHRPLSDLVGDACRDLEPGPLRIVLGHGAADALSPDTEDPARIRLVDVEKVITSGCVHYVALGDRHSTTPVGTTGRIWYSGTPEPTGFSETDAGNALVISLRRDSIGVTATSIGRWRFLRVAHAFVRDEDVVGLRAILQDIPNKEVTLVRLTLTGTLTLGGNAKLEDLLEEVGHWFAGVEISSGRSDLAVMPADGDFSDLDLSGFARAALDDLRVASEQADEGGGMARDALGLLVRLAGRSA